MGIAAPVFLGGAKTVLAVVFVFVLLIVFHEFGHFWVAKRVGILVREFAIGFGPKIFRFQRGETRYALRLFPLGGFVDMAGETPQNGFLPEGSEAALRLDQQGRVVALGDPLLLSGADVIRGRIVECDLAKQYEVVIELHGETRRIQLATSADWITEDGVVRLAPFDRQFIGKPIWARAVTIAAGPFMNFLLATVLFIVVNLSLGIPVDTPDIGTVQAGYPAAAVGIKPGDRIVAVDGAPTSHWSDLVTAIDGHRDRTVDITVQRGSQKLHFHVTPKIVDGQGRIGIGPVVTRDPLTAISLGVQETWSITTAIVSAFGHMIHSAAAPQLAGPVGIVSLIGKQAQIGFANVLQFAGFLSINLGIFNLLPIPALDGSRLVFLLVEALRGRPVDPQKESMVHLVGFGLLMLIFVLVTYHDVTRLF